MKCKAEKVDGGYVINGNKMWCTNGPSAQTLVNIPRPLYTFRIGHSDTLHPAIKILGTESVGALLVSMSSRL
jgi:alkylation response protein AidB-like acyl-CoA dehydrogenase